MRCEQDPQGLTEPHADVPIEPRQAGSTGSERSTRTRVPGADRAGRPASVALELLEPAVRRGEEAAKLLVTRGQRFEPALLLVIVVQRRLF
jgi:hypothetical protein